MHFMSDDKFWQECFIQTLWLAQIVTKVSNLLFVIDEYVGAAVAAELYFKANTLLAGSKLPTKL